MIYSVKSLTLITLLSSSVCAMNLNVRLKGRRWKRSPPPPPSEDYEVFRARKFGAEIKHDTGLSVEENIARNKTGFAHVCHQYKNLAGIYELHFLLTRYSFGGIGKECALVDPKAKTALVDLVLLKQQADGFLGPAEIVCNRMWGNERDNRNNLHFRADLPEQRGDYRQFLQEYRWRLAKKNDTKTEWGSEKFNWDADREYVKKTYTQMKEELRSIGEIFAKAIVYSREWNVEIRRVFKGISGYAKAPDCGYKLAWDRNGNYHDPWGSWDVKKLDCGSLTTLLQPLLKKRGKKDKEFSGYRPTSDEESD